MSTSSDDDVGDPEPDRPGGRRIRPVVGGRAPARERALHLLYEAALTDRDGPAVLRSQVLSADTYTEDLVRGVHDNRAEVDSLIAELAPQGWTPERMATLDRTVLQLAIYELAHRDDVPTGVVLAEAVGLAETYGTDDSPRFVNGLLAAAASRLRPEH